MTLPRWFRWPNGLVLAALGTSLFYIVRWVLF